MVFSKLKTALRLWMHPPFEIAGWMSLQGKEEAGGIWDDLFPAALCPIMSPFRRLCALRAEALAEIMPANGGTCPAEMAGGTAALTRRRIGRGRAYYFAFNLPQAVWTYHRGRPVTRDYDGDGYMRMGDAIIVPPGPAASVPFADLMILILEHILAPAGLAFVHQLPPLDGCVPDALFHYGGDDEGNGLQAQMSETMRALGLPYHVNVMLKDGRFHFTDEDRAIYEHNGHEFSLHFNFMNYPDGVKHPAPIEEAELDRQYRLFVARYGKQPVCVNNHWCRTSGWADTARCAARRGILGENHRVHHPSPPLNPVNLFGAVFGTVFPHFVHDDAVHGNARLDFIDVPIGLYEPGSATREQSHPLYGQDPFRPREYRRVTELACRFGWTLNVFLHPGPMCNPESRTRDAVRSILDWVSESRRRVVHMGTDALCLWWRARANTHLTSKGPGRYEIETQHPQGVLVRFAADSVHAPARFELDGRPAASEQGLRNGRKWVYVAIPTGRHSLTVQAST